MSNKLSRMILMVLIIVAIGFVGFKYINKPAESMSEVKAIEEEQVMRGDITIGFDGDGEAEIPSVNLDFDIGGKLVELYVSEGDEIKVGQLLGKLDDTDHIKLLKTAEVNYKKAVATLEQKIETRELSLISQKQKLEELKAKLDQEESEYLPMVKVKDLYSQQSLDIKKASYESAKAAYEAQLETYNISSKSNKDIELEKTNVESAKLSLEMAQDDLDSTALESSTEGKILNIAYKVGETISSVTDSGEVTADTTHFVVVSDADKVEVIVPISEIDLTKVEIDQLVEVEFEAFENQIFTGKVVSIDSLPKIDNSGLVTFDVTIELDTGIDKVKSGMTCAVEFIIKQQKDVVYISNKAVSMIDGSQVVKVKAQNSDIKIRNIKTGLTDGKYVEVTEGLNVGETIIIEDNKVE
ncbi:efflux RND transporter periplasmic adaptor subunit [Wukongibacter sp. M2B1]|uniref:efflux RND transporter periplasmic adaptor subunit n=1 Tax=Wukongibacter sp. M2B1 TaxID=3088895 RepID=UPI003D7A247F